MTENGDTLETVRDLSLSLDGVGDAARALGRWEEAEAAYREALILYRCLNLAFSDNAEYQQMIQALEHKITELHPSSEPTHST
jgi:flagellar biosynthesis chaperone FliJ